MAGGDHCLMSLFLWIISDCIFFFFSVFCQLLRPIPFYSYCSIALISFSSACTCASRSWLLCFCSISLLNLCSCLASCALSRLTSSWKVISCASCLNTGLLGLTGGSPWCLVLRNSMSTTVPFSITCRLMSFKGFPSTLSPINFMNPRTVGSLVRLLFQRLRQLRLCLRKTQSERSSITLLLTSSISRAGRQSQKSSSSIEPILLQERWRVRSLGIFRMDSGTLLSRLVDRSRCSSETKKGLWKNTKSVSLLCCASIVSRKGSSARLSGKLLSSLLLTISAFRPCSLSMASGMEAILLLVTLSTRRSLSKTSSCNSSMFIALSTSSPLSVNSWSNLFQNSCGVTSVEGISFFSMFWRWAGSMRSLRYFLMALTPPARMFWRMAFKGLPSTCRRNSPSMKPSSEGRSGRSLLDRSRVFSFCSFTISAEIFLILLSLRVSTERLGHLSKSLNSVSRLKESAIVSSRSDQGISSKLASLFSLSYSSTRLRVCEKAPFPILSIWFLLSVRVSSLAHLLNTSAGISVNALLEASTFLTFSPSGGNSLSLLSLICSTSSVLTPERSGRQVRAFSEMLSSTSAGQRAYSLGTAGMRLRERSSSLSICRLARQGGRAARRLFFMRSSCRSVKSVIFQGRTVISLLEKSILVMATQSHQFCSSRGRSQRRKSAGGTSLASCPTQLKVPVCMARLTACAKDFFSIIDLN